MSYLMNKYVEWRSSGRSSSDGDIFRDRASFSRYANLTGIIPEFEMRKLSNEYEQRMN